VFSKKRGWDLYLLRIGGKGLRILVQKWGNCALRRVEGKKTGKENFT